MDFCTNYMQFLCQIISIPNLAYVIFIVELFTLLVLSKILMRNVSLFFHKITRHKTLTVYLLSILFLPGTIIHELAHLLMAEILRVPTGHINLIPEVVGSDIKMGSVQIAHTDPFRRFLIGIAPFLFGNFLLFGAVNLSINNFPLNNTFIIIIHMYLIFQIGNTMFSSKKDMEGALQLIFAAGLLLLVVIIAGARVNFEHLTIPPIVTEIFQKACIYLLIPIMLDLILIISLKILRR